MKARRMAPDALLFAGTLALLLFGLVMLYSASAIVADANSRSPFFFFGRQAVWAVLGFVAMMVIARVDYRVLNRPTVAWCVLGAAVLALTAALLSPPIAGTHRWVRLFGFAFQPSEPAKLALAVALAHLLASRPPDTLRRLALPLGVTALLAGLIFSQPDLGTATFLALIGGALLFVGGARFLHLGALAAAGVPLFAAGVLTADYRLARVLTFLDPFGDPLGDGFQLSQSLIALGAGGISGVGFSAGRQKLLYLPEPHSDFIFSVVGEELGLIGAAAVVAAFLLFAVRGLLVSSRAADRFGLLLGVGATLTVSAQALLNISVAIGLVPTTGLPLPFVSAGGSSLLTTMMAAGLLLSVSQRAP